MPSGDVVRHLHAELLLLGGVLQHHVAGGCELPGRSMSQVCNKHTFAQ